VAALVATEYFVVEGGVGLCSCYVGRYCNIKIPSAFGFKIEIVGTGGIT
jgi:hypothetical protein